MPDIADHANNQVALATDRLIKARKDVPDIKPDGFCHNCYGKIPMDLRWCDTECRDEWEQHNLK